MASFALVLLWLERRELVRSGEATRLRRRRATVKIMGHVLDLARAGRSCLAQSPAAYSGSLFVGSVAESVVRTSPCPVLIVRQPKAEKTKA